MIEDDPDVAFQRVVAAGATVVWSVNNQPFGWCVGRIVDPFGHKWQLATRKEEVSPQEMQKRWGAMFS